MDKAGKLYVVATPIGNMDDITLRALNIFKNADIVAAEDTRNTGKLLAYHNIKASLVSYHEYNEKQKASELIDELKQGKSVALVSDAGTPTVSDPGYRLIKQAVAEKIQVIPIPGVSAVTAGLSVSGLPTDSFVFTGFSSKNQNRRLNHLKKLADFTQTLVFYESPARILSFIQELIENIGNREAVLCREMTKIHEEFIRGSLCEIFFTLKNRLSVKGECTLLVSGKKEDSQSEENFSMEMLENEILKELKENKVKISELSKNIAKKYNISRKTVYEQALKIKEE